MKLLVVFWVLLVCTSVFATPAIDNTDNTIIQSFNRNQFEETFLKKLNTKCTQRDNSACIMLKWMSYMNRMLKKSSIDIGQNFMVTQTSREVEVTMDPEDDLMLSRAARSDDETLSFIIADKLWNFIQSRTLRYKMHNDADLVVSTERGNLNIGFSINPKNALETGRGRLRNIAPLIAAVAAKVGVIGVLLFKGLVLLVGKALVVSKLALVLAVVLGLKNLLSKKHVTYEVVAHPHHTESHHVAQPPTPHTDSYSTGWGRALEGFFESMDNLPQNLPDGQEQAYNAHSQ